MDRYRSSISERRIRFLRQAKSASRIKSRFSGLRCKQGETCLSDLLMRIEALEDVLFCRIISYAPEAFMRVSLRAAETWRFHRTFAMPLKCSEVTSTLRRSPNLRCLFLGEYLTNRAIKTAYQSRHIGHLPIETLKLHLSESVPEAYVLRLLQGVVRLRHLELVGNCLPKLLPRIAKMVEEGQLEYVKLAMCDPDFDQSLISHGRPPPRPRLKSAWLVNLRVPFDPHVWPLPAALNHLCLEGCLLGNMKTLAETNSASTSTSSSIASPSTSFAPSDILACGLGTLGSLRSLDLDNCTSSDWSIVADLVQGQCDLELLRLACKPEDPTFSAGDRWLLDGDEPSCSSSLRFLIADVKLRDTALVKLLIHYKNLQCLLLPHQTLTDATTSLLLEELGTTSLLKRRPCLIIVLGTNEAAENLENALNSHGWNQIIVRTPPVHTRKFQDITDKLVYQLTANENKERVCVLGRRIARDFRQCIRTKHPLLTSSEEQGLGTIGGKTVFLRPVQGSSGFRLNPLLIDHPDEFLQSLWYNSESDVPSSFVNQRKSKMGGKVSIDDFNLKQFVTSNVDSRYW